MPECFPAPGSPGFPDIARLALMGVRDKSPDIARLALMGVRGKSPDIARLALIGVRDRSRRRVLHYFLDDSVCTDYYWCPEAVNNAAISPARPGLRTSLSVCAILLALLAFVTPASALSPKTIPAKAAVIMDASGAVLFGKFQNAKLAPASTVKLVTAMVVLDTTDPALKVRISRNAAGVRSIEPRIHADEEMAVSDLLHLALMKSVNSAAVALAEATAGSEQAFVPLMNRKARELGATTTLFANASGLPKGYQYTTASDLAVIMKAALSYPLIREILAKKAWLITTTEGRPIFVENSNELLWQQENVIGGKTGYTGNARHCFVCAINTDKGPFYTAVLGARSRSSLWRSTLILAEIGRNPDLAAAKEQPRKSRRVPRARKSSKLVASQPAAAENRAPEQNVPQPDPRSM